MEMLDLKSEQVRKELETIQFLKDYFKNELKQSLSLIDVPAPLTVISGVGINDDLNGVEKPVSFKSECVSDNPIEIVQSLAKWKRLKLHDWDFPIGSGIITDMKAIRPDEDPDLLHSIMVDQWDWELSIKREDRNIDYLKSIVLKIYHAIYKLDEYVKANIAPLKTLVPKNITFVHSEELRELYPELSPKEREYSFVKKHKAVFIIGIGGTLKDGVPHDLRAPDYDDWTTKNSEGYYGLNGDILVWSNSINQPIELSSMGIRVDSLALVKQLEITKTTKRKYFDFHSKIIKNEIPFSIGGGIGQSRLIMYLLQKKHIGEVQISTWPKQIVSDCLQSNVVLL